jgi:glutaredoxin 3
VIDAVIDKAPHAANLRRKGVIAAMAQVEIYTKAYCPYCVRAKSLLGDKGVAFQEYDISMGGPLRAEMIERSKGGATVPQIFIDGRHVGGSDDLARLNRDGKLDPLLGL